MLQDIRELLKGTFLEDAMMMELEIPRTTDIAIAISINSENAIDAWKLLKSHIDQTQRYPVITTCWGSDSPTWEQSIIDNERIQMIKKVSPLSSHSERSSKEVPIQE
jgi:hypothetical protein